MLIDSHAHLDMKEFNSDRQQILDRALKGGITNIITIGVDLSSSYEALELANKYDFIFSSIGFHPHNADKMDPSDLKALCELVSDPNIVAWGEIGLDFYHHRSPPDKQVDVFEQQLEMAAHFNLPVIIHDRDAHREVLKILQKREKGHNKGVIHCYSGDYDLAIAFIEMGYYISIPGTVTYKKAFQIQDVAARIPLEYMLVETDAPFLAPVPKRGKRNEPLLVTHTAKKIAQLRNMDFNEIAHHTSENTRRLFKLPAQKVEGTEKISDPVSQF
ncbi:MAG: TatD family hydrolase [Thermodesulfobacteriota bacterium]|nr:TatD family hydrolase [Thermodesulfobacteriota bacterium]